MFTPILLILLTSCSLIRNNNTPATKLYVFDCGEITVKDISLFSPGVDKGVTKRLTNSCYLIQHPRGNFVWDAGLSDELFNLKNGVKVGNGMFHLKVKKTLESQLKEIGLTYEDIDYIALSHFHFDHTGNLNKFKNAKVLIQQEEFKAAFSKDAKKYHFDPATYSNLKKENFIPINGRQDIFGDNKIVILPAKGHTPGHQVLLVNLEDEGPVILSGDLFHFTKNRTHKRVPALNYDRRMSIQAIDEIEEVIVKKKAQMWIGHDLEQNQKINHSPKYYR
jgi:glyoxylase-like metal-dependent hydrolase (beta-lactamase superfamily II)